MSQLAEQLKSHHIELELQLNDDDVYDKEEQGLPSDVPPPPVPSVCGLPLKYVSCVALSSQSLLDTDFICAGL